MNKLAKWLSIIAVLALALAVYLVVSAQLTAAVISVQVESAADRLETSETLCDALERGDLDTNQYRQITSDAASDYTFITYTVTLSSLCPLPAEWAVLSLSPLDGDIAFLPGDAQDVSPFGTRTINATLLTTHEDPQQTTRNLWVEYYVFGRAMSAVAESQA